MKKHFILIGYGDVGMSIASALEKALVSFVVVDKNEAKFKDKNFKYVAGDATDEEVLKRADLKNATSVIIVLNNDTDIIFTSLIARTLNPHCIIISRANATKSIDKIYRAGADYVASLSIVAAQMLARIIIGHEIEETIKMFEGLEIERYHVTKDSPLAGERISDACIRSRIGCTIIGIEEDGKTTTDIDPSIVIKEGMTLAVIGNCDQITKFKEEYTKSQKD
ncbi:Calcium-gated potassium channel MthK [uncultured archaeon]|nr:Calcium-gated potassium channel MthK [uncultured archaeon]